MFSLNPCGEIPLDSEGKTAILNVDLQKSFEVMESILNENWYDDYCNIPKKKKYRQLDDDWEIQNELA